MEVQLHNIDANDEVQSTAEVSAEKAPNIPIYIDDWRWPMDLNWSMTGDCHLSSSVSQMYAPENKCTKCVRISNSGKMFFTIGG